MQDDDAWEQRRRRDHQMRFEGAHALMLSLGGVVQFAVLSYWFGAPLFAALLSAGSEWDFRRGVNRTPVRGYDDVVGVIHDATAGAHVALCMVVAILFCYNATALSFYAHAPAHLRWRMALLE